MSRRSFKQNDPPNLKLLTSPPLLDRDFLSAEGFQRLVLGSGGWVFKILRQYFI